MNSPSVEFRNISKRFGGVAALTDVSVEIRSGECHALMGENGAGQSTLGKALAGIHRADGGVVLLGGGGGERVRGGRALLGQVGAEMDVRTPMSGLSTAQEQMVQIAAAIGTGAKVLV